MTLQVIKPGLQTTLQGAPCSGHRHLGMPAAGAADCFSLALANNLVGNAPDAVALEMTLDDAKFAAMHPLAFAVSGAASFLRINGEDKPTYASVSAKPGDEIHIGSVDRGCRSYLAISGSIESQTLLSGQSTYLAASLGGFHGRALQVGDVVKCTPDGRSVTRGKKIPDDLRPIMSGKYLIRVTAGPEYSQLDDESQIRLFANKYKAGTRINRMGISLNSGNLETTNALLMKSAPVFPGTIQCPPDGAPFLLGPDAQTTGGYPRIAQVIRADRHLIGQVRSGSEIQFVMTSNERATEIYRQKLSLLAPMLGIKSLW